MIGQALVKAEVAIAGRRGLWRCDLMLGDYRGSLALIVGAGAKDRVDPSATVRLEIQSGTIRATLVPLYFVYSWKVL